MKSTAIDTKVVRDLKTGWSGDDNRIDNRPFHPQKTYVAGQLVFQTEDMVSRKDFYDKRKGFRDIVEETDTFDRQMVHDLVKTAHLVLNNER